MPDSDFKAEKFESELLEERRSDHEQFVHERRMRQYTTHESLQKLVVRWISIVAGAGVMGLMVWMLLYHMLCRPMSDSGYAWVMIAAPIASLTIIATAFLIAGFPRRGDKDAGQTTRDSANAALKTLGEEHLPTE